MFTHKAAYGRSVALWLAASIVCAAPVFAQAWTPIDNLMGRLVAGTLMNDTIKTQVSMASDGTLFALDKKDQIWKWNYTDSKWDLASGALRVISVASKDNVWGINAAGQIFRYTPTTNWVQIAPPASPCGMAMYKLSAASDGTVIGILCAKPYLYNAASKSWSEMASTGLTTAGVGFAEIAVGSADHIWALDGRTVLYRFNRQANAWGTVPQNAEIIKQISVGSDGEVWGTSGNSDQGRVWRWNGTAWDRMLGNLAQVSIGHSDYLAGITVDSKMPLGALTGSPTDTERPHHTVIGARNPSFCWKNTVQRGVGTIPQGCSLDQQKRGLLCYPACKAGYTGFVATCAQDCPEGYRNDGLFCAKPAAYGRGAGYAWQIGDPAFSGDGQLARCAAAEGRPCEMNGALAYPTCKTGYAAVGANICSPACPAGMTDIGASCTKQTYTQSASLLQCAAGQEKDAGLCYPACPASTTGVGPVCWGNCSGGTPFTCGFGCAKDQASCAQHTSDIVISTVSSIISLASIAYAPGMGDIANAAMKEGLRQTAITIAKNVAPKLVNTAIKESIVAMSELSGVDVSSTAVNNWGSFMNSLQTAGADPNNLSMAYQVIESLPVDASMLDITGLSKLAISLTNPVCAGPAGNWADVVAANKRAGVTK